MTSLADIASAAFDGVNSGITDIVFAARIYEWQRGSWNPSKAEYDRSLVAIGTQGQCLFDTGTPVEDLFPEAIAGPTDYLIFARGLGVVPKENQFIRIGSVDYSIKAVTDVLKAGSVFYLLVSYG